ncbi:MAG TPA: hypothetical protein DD473_17415 [Planctomycetaceae bacterium]|nr:hypothetical protein [Planctomycetaceae bacterium]
MSLYSHEKSCKVFAPYVFWRSAFNSSFTMVMSMTLRNLRYWGCGRSFVFSLLLWMLLIVFVHEDGRAGFFLLALFADDADQVGTAEF